MKILINGSCMEGRRTGVGRYMANILRVWAEKYSCNQYNLLFRNEIPGDQALFASCVQSKLIFCPKLLNRNSVWENLFMPFASFAGTDPDIFFSPAYTLPAISPKGKKAVTIFDISYISHPEWFPFGQRVVLNILTGPTLKKADVVFTGSEASKREILRFYDIDEDKINITQPAVDPKFSFAAAKPFDREAFFAKHDLRGKVVLYIGLIANRRNVPTIIESVAKIKHSAGEEVTLVIIGSNFTYPLIDVHEVANKHGLSENLRWMTYVDDGELFAFYKAADVFIYPSTYEGFGIPPLEAMYMGIPVITSNMSSIPEVVGDVAVLLDDPSDPVEMTAALEKVLWNEQMSADMIARGKERAKLFSWENCADSIMAHFERII